MSGSIFFCGRCFFSNFSSYRGYLCRSAFALPTSFRALLICCFNDFSLQRIHSFRTVGCPNSSSTRLLCFNFSRLFVIFSTFVLKLFIFFCVIFNFSSIDTLKKKMKSWKKPEEIDTEEYKELSTKVEESTKSLEELKQKKKQVDEEFGHPISPGGMDARCKEKSLKQQNEYKALEKRSEVQTLILQRYRGNWKSWRKSNGSRKKMLPLTESTRRNWSCICLYG